jgi:hypothetical protein
MILRAALLAALVALPVRAAETLPLPLDYDPTIVWFDTPWITPEGEGRVRIVTGGREIAAALNVNQFYHYRLAYRRALAELAQRMTVAQAEPRARHAAFHAVLRAYPQFRASGYALRPIDPIPGLTP